MGTFLLRILIHFSIVLCVLLLNCMLVITKMKHFTGGIELEIVAFFMELEGVLVAYLIIYKNVHVWDFTHAVVL